MASSGSSKLAPKSNLGLIIGIAAGALFLCCCAPGIGAPAIWYFLLDLKPAAPDKNGGQAKAKEADKDKDEDKDGAKAKPDERIKKHYNAVQIGMQIDDVEKVVGRLGERILTSKLPKLENKELDTKLVKELRDNRINLFEWREPNTDDRLVVGYREGSVAIFRAHYFGPDGKAKIEYEMNRNWK